MQRWFLIFMTLSWLAGSAMAQTNATRLFDNYFVGFESEPAMDYGGRDIATLHSGISRAMGWILKTDRRPYLAPIYEFVFAGGLSVVQHEVFGHGSRAREFNLDPTYGFGLDFSGWTSIGKDPRDNLENILLCTGGTEADSVLAHRLLRDLYTGDGANGSTVPLMALAKVDFSLYCFITPDPAAKPASFRDEYDNGNDIAAYLVSRQGQRRRANPAAVWNNTYRIDFTDRQLGRNYDDLRAAAVWNLADPAAIAAFYGYVADHALRGRTQVRPPVIPIGGGFGLTAGTRAFAGVEDVTRFLDLYLVTPGPLINIYGRDLQGSLDRTYGYGAGIYGLPLGRNVTLAVAGDIWKEPLAPEGLFEGDGWNVTGELDVLMFDRVGVACKLGAKSEGFFPGAPIESGVYGGGGLILRF